MAVYFVLILISSSLSASLSKSIKHNGTHLADYNGIPITIQFNALLNISIESNDTGEPEANPSKQETNVQPVKGEENIQKRNLDGSDHSKSMSDCFDYGTLCKSLVGTSKIPQCYGLESKEGIGIREVPLPKSCREIYLSGNHVSGIYEIQPRASNKSIMALCDMQTRGGGWIYIQKRYDGSQDFYLNWRDYKFGFGDLNREFWIDLENIHLITGFETTELLVELEDAENKQAYAQYEAFGVGAEKEGYPLITVKGYSGNAGDDMLPQLGSKFTTKDFDQDISTQNCAVQYSGAWWYKGCHKSNLNGQYWTGPAPPKYTARGVHWHSFKGHEYSLAATRMLVRPVLT